MAQSLSTLSKLTRQTGWTVLDEANFARGVIKDTAPVALPAGSVSDAHDFLFDRPGVIRKRGGTAYQAGALGIATQVYQIGFANYSAGPKVIAVANGGTANAIRVYNISTVNGDIGAGGSATNRQKPVFYNDKLFLMEGGSASVPLTVDSSLTLADLAGTPPAAKYGCAHGGYLVVANTAANPNRLWFGPIPDVTTTWDTTNAYIDTNEAITGLASIQGVLVVFHSSSTERVLGSVPPGTTGENMSLQPLGRGGCVDARTISPTSSTVLYADQDGVWLTNGSSVTSLTEKPDGTGISSYWRTQMAAYDSSAMILTAGTFSTDYYFVSLLSQVSNQWLSSMFLSCYLPTGAWKTFTGINCEMFAPFASGPTQTFAAQAREGRVLKLDDVFKPVPANKNDAEGAAVTPAVTLRVLGVGPFQKAWGHGHVTYDMRDAASDNPTLAVETAPGIEQTTWTAAAESPLAETTDATRKRFTVSKDSQGMSVRLTQTNASSRTEIYAVEVEVRPYGEQADGQ